jgi:hypothetical protein
MKTKDFIKMLQEEDPSGEAHIRMMGGTPRYAELKPGYYDGPYSYVDENGNFVSTSQGAKVDIHCVDLEDFIIDLVDIDEENNWETIKKKLLFDYDNYMIVEQRQERIDKKLKLAKEIYDKQYQWEFEYRNHNEKKININN